MHVRELRDINMELSGGLLLIYYGFRAQMLKLCRPSGCFKINMFQKVYRREKNYNCMASNSQSTNLCLLGCQGMLISCIYIYPRVRVVYYLKKWNQILFIVALQYHKC